MSSVPDSTSDALLTKQFCKELLTLSFVPEAVKADVARDLINTEDLRSDACRMCGSLFTATSARVALCQRPRSDSSSKRKKNKKHRTTQLTVTCTRCRTTFDPVQLPRPVPAFKKSSRREALNNDATKATPQHVKQSVVLKPKKQREIAPKLTKGLVLPKLTSRDLKGKKTNRLSKLVAAMESTDASTSSTAGSSLGAFLSSL